MKKVFCALLMLGLSSTALAAKPYYVCSLNHAGPYVQADAEILIQFKGNQIAIKGSEATGTCIGEVKYMGSDGHYGSRFSFGGDYGKANANCNKFDDVQWYSTNEGFASLHPNTTVDLDNIFVGGVWARYTCK
ncbi:hypothetical protein EZJ49_07505 [Bdellovibrio bacteriovorus]|uniref:hypothetical protein n=1 Tax=Bdellovibrio bacteriovorus TaxID=959 RepID=UPI0021D02245|nr:hypothetical protein [Bdellovibrio bacteriovorus]UXR66094.1 hypothetical protein EZJ49_07505 [Bdellovibrio bacteriovorus]